MIRVVEMSKQTGAPELDASIVIAAPPNRILKAFFEPDALNAWCQVTHAVTMARVLGPYAIAWPATEYRDDVLGRLGGVFRGTVMQFQAGHGFFVADVFFLPPVGVHVTSNAIGPIGSPSGGRKNTSATKNPWPA